MVHYFAHLEYRIKGSSWTFLLSTKCFMGMLPWSGNHIASFVCWCYGAIPKHFILWRWCCCLVTFIILERKVFFFFFLHTVSRVIYYPERVSLWSLLDSSFLTIATRFWNLGKTLLQATLFKNVIFFVCIFTFLLNWSGLGYNECFRTGLPTVTTGHIGYFHCNS